MSWDLFWTGGFFVFVTWISLSIGFSFGRTTRDDK